VSRILVEDELFTRQLESLAQALPSEEVLDEALNAVAWALSRKPEALPVIPDTNSLRVIRTLGYERSGITVPPFKVWYRILDDTRVLLLAITKENDKEPAD
jgi:hypothetical protein